MIVAKGRPAPMDDADQRAVGGRGETHFDCGVFPGFKGGVAPGKGQPIGRVPGADAAHFEYPRAAIRIDGFEQPPAHMGLQPYEAAAPPGVAEFDAATPPAIDVSGEYIESDRGRNGDRDAHARGVIGHDLRRAR